MKFTNLRVGSPDCHVEQHSLPGAPSVLGQPVFVSGLKVFARKRLLNCALIGCAILVLAPSCHRGWSQTGTTATISGTITDPTGAAVAGAQVTVRNVGTNLTRTVTTLDNGNYALTQPTPGHYSLTVDKPGFKSYQQNDIVLVIGQVAEIKALLQLGSEQQRVTVTANAPVIQTERFFCRLSSRCRHHRQHTAEWPFEHHRIVGARSRHAERGCTGPDSCYRYQSSDWHRCGQFERGSGLHARRSRQHGSYPGAR